MDWKLSAINFADAVLSKKPKVEEIQAVACTILKRDLNYSGPDAVVMSMTYQALPLESFTKHRLAAITALVELIDKNHEETFRDLSSFSEYKELRNKVANSMAEDGMRDLL